MSKTALKITKEIIEECIGVQGDVYKTTTRSPERAKPNGKGRRLFQIANRIRGNK